MNIIKTISNWPSIFLNQFLKTSISSISINNDGFVSFSQSGILCVAAGNRINVVVMAVPLMLKRPKAVYFF